MVKQQRKTAGKMPQKRFLQSSGARRLAVTAVAGFTALALSASLLPTADAADLKGVTKTAAKANKDGAKFQKTVDGLHSEKETLLSEYESVLQQSEALAAYNAQLAKLVKSQETELGSLTEQIGRVTVVSRALTPLMLKMIEALDSFVNLDVPFFLEERQKRVAKLKKLMDQADISESEKFRQIVEAYQIETDYGTNIDAYKGAIELDGAERTVNFLRIGRVALIFQSLDDEIVGHWNPTLRAFETLGSEHRDSIKYGMQVALKQRAPNDLLTLPLLGRDSDGK